MAKNTTKKTTTKKTEKLTYCAQIEGTFTGKFTETQLAKLGTLKGWKVVSSDGKVKLSIDSVVTFDSFA